MLLSAMRQAIRIELQDIDAETEVYKEEELDRAITKAGALMSRLIPKRDLLEDTLEATMFSSANDYKLKISGMLSDYVRLEKIEYPVDDTPPCYPTFEVLGDYALFKGAQEFTTGDTIRFIYLKRWTMPTLAAIGDYPTHLDEAIIIGASGESLIYKAQLYTKQAVDLITASGTNIAAVPTFTVPTAPTITTNLGVAIAQLVLASAEFLKDTSNALNLNSAGITTAELELVQTKAELTTALGYLTSGAALINSATRGSNVGEIYGQYANAAANIAGVSAKIVDAYLSIAATLKTISDIYAATGNGYIAVAVQYLNEVEKELDKYRLQLEASNQNLTYIARLLDVSARYETSTKQLLEVAGRYLADGQSKIQEFMMMLGYKPEFVSSKSSSEQRA
jgi:hypothetical protein